MAATRDIRLAIEELSLSGSVSIARCSKSTLYRWKKDVNELLERENCNWRVESEYDEQRKTGVLKVKM